MNYLKKVNKTATDVCPAVMLAILISLNAQADEIGVATGVNSSMYKSWDKTNAEYQKTDILNPIAITYQKDFMRFFGIHTTLQFSYKSISQTIHKTRINPETYNIEPAGTIKFVNTKKFLTLEFSPIFFHRLNDFSFDVKFGLTSDLYLNEWTNNFGEKSSTMRSKEINPLVLSVVSGVGLGYIFKDKFKIGIGSNVSRTLTDIYKNQADDADIFYLVPVQN